MIKLYTDGACKGNPGPGGWAYVLEYNDYRIFGGDAMKQTTNNRQELYAVIFGLEKIKDRTIPVTVFSDSMYVIQGATKWLPDWKLNGWKTKQDKMVANQDLWKLLDRLLGDFDQVSFTHVKAHSGNLWNEFADELASSAAILAMEELTQPEMRT